MSRARLLRGTVLATVAVVVLAAGCTGRTAEPATDPTTATPTTSPTPTEPPTITIAIGGDTALARGELTGPLLDDPANAVGPVSEVFKAADIGMVNLEESIAPESECHRWPKTFTYRGDPVIWDALRAGGLDLVTVANNHALDCGASGFDSELATAAAAGFPLVGGGVDDAAAYAPWIAEVKGVRIAFLGFDTIMDGTTAWHAAPDHPGIAEANTPDQLARAAQAVRDAKAQADVVIVYMHWGQEHYDCPIAKQREVVEALSAAGAAAIVGTHAHRILGDGWYGDTYVHYGLSNFLWLSVNPHTYDTLVVRLTLTGSTITKTELVPAIIKPSTGQPIPVTGDQADRINADSQARHNAACNTGNPGGLADAPATLW